MKKSLKTGLVALIMLFATSNIFAQVSIGISISAHVAPPPLPVYSQPPCPTDGYLWVPGYWAWSDDLQDYYWVPGVWMAPPRPGLLWTPAYWGYSGGVYGFHAGYWGVHVGFYGGINYGYGYCGTGFVGGGWSGDHFRYNTAVVNVNKTVVHNTYVDETVNVHNTVINNNRVSFNGGQGGVQARPRPEEMAAMREQHIQPTAEQTTHQNHAMQDRSQFFKNNGGRPERAAVNRVGGTQFRGADNSPRPQQNAGQPMGRNGNNPRFNGNANEPRSNGANANQMHANAMDVNTRNNQIKNPDAYHNNINQPQPGNRAPQNNMQQQQRMHAMQQPRMQQPHMQPQHMQAPRMQQPHMARPQPHEERRH